MNRVRTQTEITQNLDPSRKGQYYTEYRVIGLENDILRWVATTGQVFFKDNKPVKVIGTVTNITQRKKMEVTLINAKEELEAKVKERTSELAESEEKYRLLVENASEAVGVIQDGKFVFINPKGTELSGYSREEMLSSPVKEFIYPGEQDMVMLIYNKVIKGEHTPNSYEFRIRTNEGKIKWAEMHAVMINWMGRPAVLGLLTDITERKNMEQELKAYAQRITQVQEEERKKIAYELHDDTAQYLSILKLQIDSVISSGKIQDPEILKKLQYLEKDAERAMDDVRRYSHELRPGVLEHLGLLAALEQIAEDNNKLQQIAVEIEVEGSEPEISEDMRLGFFRIAQEAINNARKHSRSPSVRISLNFQNDCIKMTVKDYGVGFDVKETKNRTGIRGSLGLMSMQERARLIGANLKIDSTPGKGTVITAEARLDTTDTPGASTG